MKNMKKTAAIAVISGVLLLSGCATTFTTRPIHDVEYTYNTSVSVDKVRDVILKAGKNRGWKMREEGKGVIIGVVNNRGMSATSKITYDNRHYVITYVASTGLREAPGKIHKAYYRWVDFLNKDIQNNLD